MGVAFSGGKPAKPLAITGENVIDATPTLPVSRIHQRVGEILALVPTDPASALAKAKVLRKERPDEVPLSLPLPLRLQIEGPDPAAVRITSDGRPVVAAAGFQLCRFADRSFTLQVSADGYRSQEVVVAPDTSTAEIVQSVMLYDEPAWIQQPFAPAWVRLLEFPSS